MVTVNGVTVIVVSPANPEWLEGELCYARRSFEDSLSLLERVHSRTGFSHVGA